MARWDGGIYGEQPRKPKPETVGTFLQRKRKEKKRPHWK